jgi:hypothetical protein
MLGIGIGIAFLPSGGAAPAVPGVLTANAAVFQLAGQTAVLTVQRKLVAAQGSFTMIGQAAELTYSGTPSAAPTYYIYGF